MTARRFAIQLMIAQAVLFAAETAALHQIGNRMSIMMLALLRSVGGVTLVFLLARKIGLAVIRTRQPALQLVRGSVSLLYLWVMMYSFAHMPFADATAISYTQSAYIAAFSALILGEAISGSRWAAAAIGIFGALLIAKPGLHGWNAVYLVALIGTGFNGLAFVLNRYLQREDSEETTMFYSNLVPLLGNIPALFLIGELPAPEMLIWLPGVLVLGPLGMFAGIVALKHSSASALGPYTLLRLVIGLIAGAFIFRELPDLYSAAGAGLIVASCAMATRAFKALKTAGLRGYRPEQYPSAAG